MYWNLRIYRKDREKKIIGIAHLARFAVLPAASSASKKKNQIGFEIFNAISTQLSVGRPTTGGSPPSLFTIADPSLFYISLSFPQEGYTRGQVGFNSIYSRSFAYRRL